MEAATKLVKVALVDDHPVVREGVRMVLTKDPAIAVVTEASCGEELLDVLQHNEIDVVVLDLSMPGLSGVELVERVHEDMPEVRILILSIHSDPALINQCLNAGASGYVSKECAPTEMVAAIHRVQEKGFYLSSAIERVLHDEGVSETLRVPLSKRELQIYHLLAEGQSPTEIAADLSISIKTVSTHKKNIFKKMGFSNLSDLVKYSISHPL